MNAESPFGDVQPDDPPMSYCPEHSRKFDPYKEQCPQCSRESAHAEARQWLKEQKRARVTVEIDPVTSEGMIPAYFEGDALVEWQGESRLIRVKETEPESNTHPAHRYFTLEGGFPIDWYEDELTAALSKALDARMMAIPKLV